MGHKSARRYLRMGPMSNLSINQNAKNPIPEIRLAILEIQKSGSRSKACFDFLEKENLRQIIGNHGIFRQIASSFDFTENQCLVSKLLKLSSSS